MTKKPSQQTEKVREYKARRINFEKNLETGLERAHKCHAQGDFIGMCFQLQDVWRKTFQKDKELILDLVKKREGQMSKDNRTRAPGEGQHITESEYLKLITAGRDYAVDFPSNYEGRLTRQEWMDILQDMTEALYLEYMGEEREWTKDKFKATE